MPEIDTLDRASLEGFFNDLISAGFEPVIGTDRREWVGPSDPSLRKLTDTQQMRIEVRDGWPFIPPYVYARGLSADHVSARGIICLWRDDDPSRQWITLEGIHERLTQWVDFAVSGAFRPGDLALDSHVGFERHAGVIATFQLWDLVGRDPLEGTHGVFRAQERTKFHTELASAEDASSLRGRWFYRNRLEHPPRTLSEFKDALTRSQRRAFEREAESPAQRQRLDIAVLVWRRGPYWDVLPLRLTRADGELVAEALEPAPYDVETLRIRAGSDVETLLSKKVCVLGLGAVGSHIALSLAQSGLGELRAADADRLRPGNAVRHAGGLRHIGWPKIEVVRELLGETAPWTKLDAIYNSPVSPQALREVLAGQDLIIDATGSRPVSEMLSLIAEEQGVHLVSAALFRNGSVGRVRRQAVGTDTPIHVVIRDGLGTRVPPDVEEEGTLEIGCSAPVTNASPSAAIALSATTTRVSIDLLRNSLDYDSEVVEIYRPLQETGFDSVGMTNRSL